MNTVGLIFARGGSKGLPGKNIRMFNGKPLIAWSIQHALAVKEIDRVVVSTDSEEIAEVAIEFGAEIPFIRPNELSEDGSSEWLAWQHAINFFKNEKKAFPDIMVSIPATSPLRIIEDIENCLKTFKINNFDAVISITESKKSPYFNIVKKNNDGSIELLIQPKKIISNRQLVPEAFDITTVCYVLSTEFIINNNSIFDGNIGSSYVPIERSIDIDTLQDFQFAEYIFKLNNK